MSETPTEVDRDRARKLCPCRACNPVMTPTPARYCEHRERIAAVLAEERQAREEWEAKARQYATALDAMGTCGRPEHIGVHCGEHPIIAESSRQFLRALRQKERERCAKVAEAISLEHAKANSEATTDYKKRGTYLRSVEADAIADAIRALSEEDAQ